MDEKRVFLKRFEEKLKTKLDSDTLSKLSKGNFDFDDELNSSDYEEFRKESIPKTANLYEKAAGFAEKILNISPDEKTAKKIELELYSAHLHCTPRGVQSLSVLVPVLLIIPSLLLFVTYSSLVGIGLLLIGLSSYFIMQAIPSLLSRKMRARANDEVIIAVFYVVAFMRFNSNLELAVTFAANYLNPPLSLDFKRLLWELENAKYPNIKNAFDHYLEGWRDENLEFLEAVYLIESSLFESEEFRRITLLDKALDTILQGNYEKMLHFAQELRGKVTTFNMIGIVLPILGLIILPLAASFGDPKTTWQVVFILYNIILPVAVSYFGFIIIFNRPSSVNSIKPPENIKNFENMQKVKLKFFRKEKYISPKYPAIAILVFFLALGFFPILIHGTFIEGNLNTVLGNIFGENSPFGVFQEYKRIDAVPMYDYGPYGVYPGIISLFIPIGLAFSLGYYYKNRYKNLIHLRDKTKKLEKEFPSATFQLGNRINEGISAELAFGAVADTMKGTEAGVFFSKIDSNIKFSGMNVEKAIFDTEKGAINEYPSDLIVSSMKIFVKSIERGPNIAAKTLVDLSKYLSEIHMSNERMLDLLGESLGSMKSQASFLAPIISAVVISIVSLVTMIMGTLSRATERISQEASSQQVGNFLGESIPTYLFQFSVGIYIVSLVIILVYITTNLENGEDPINTRYQIGVKLMSAITKYSVLVVIGILGFAFIGSRVLGSIV